MAKGGKRKGARKSATKKSAKKTVKKKSAKAKGAKKSAKRKSTKRKSAKAPSAIARKPVVLGSFTTYVLSFEKNPTAAARFRANPTASVDAYQKLRRCTFTQGQLEALLNGNGEAINAQIDIECAAGGVPIPLVTHVGGTWP